MYDFLTREKSPLHEDLSFQEEDMEIPPSKEDQDLKSLIDGEEFSTIEEEEEKARDNSAVMTRAHLVPHEEEYGALAPRRETLALLQGVPKNITYGDCGTIHVQHVPLLLNGEILKIEEDEGKDKHHMHTPLSISEV